VRRICSRSDLRRSVHNGWLTPGRLSRRKDPLATSKPSWQGIRACFLISFVIRRASQANSCSSGSGPSLGQVNARTPGTTRREALISLRNIGGGERIRTAAWRFCSPCEALQRSALKCIDVVSLDCFSDLRTRRGPEVFTSSITSSGTVSGTVDGWFPSGWTPGRHLPEGAGHVLPAVVTLPKARDRCVPVPRDAEAQVLRRDIEPSDLPASVAHSLDRYGSGYATIETLNTGGERTSER
jgi:hypothetical protein